MPAKPHQRTCAHCGNDYIATRTTSRFCSRSCAMLARPPLTLEPRRCPTCGTQWRPNHATARFCSPRCRPGYGQSSRTRAKFTRERPCGMCGTELRARRNVDKFCSPTCQQTDEYQRRVRDGRLAAYLESRKGRHVCIVCGETCPGVGGKYCSNTCQAEHEHGPGRGPKPVLTERQRAAVRKLRRAERGTTGGRVVWAQGKCRRCGVGFTAQCNGAVAAYCSDLCKRRDKNSRRRALEAGADLSPGRRYRVFEGDGWMCQICGDPVNRDAKVPELDAPVIDHKVPLAQGGAHCEENWQTAHFYCNSVKRDTDLCLLTPIRVTRREGSALVV